MTRSITDDEIWHFWLTRGNIHNGDLKPQLVDFARAVIAFNDGLKDVTSVDRVSPVLPDTCRLTRVSVTRSDKGFTRTPEWFRVRLNGEVMHNVITADAEAGFVEVLLADGVSSMKFGEVQIDFIENIAVRPLQASSTSATTEVSGERL